jgi:HAD superfamily hydrolase (TIGR01509 family)
MFMKFPHKIRGILWDNDGVLVDSEKIYFEANRHILRRAGIRLTHELFADVSLKQGLSLMDLAAQKGWTRRHIARLREDRDRFYLALLRRKVSVFPGVKKTLRWLQQQGIRMGIVTSSQRVHFDAIHKKSELLHYFDFVLTRENYGRGKPAPDGYRQGLQRLGIPSRECLVIEDSERGLSAAHAAGLACVVIPHKHSVCGDYSKAVKILSRVSYLPALLKHTR